MKIEFHCPQCSKTVRAPLEAAGRRGKCPKCRSLVDIPQRVSSASQESETPDANSHLADFFEQELEPDTKGRASSSRCRECGAPMESDAILCISCGYDTRTRKKVEQASTSSIEVQAEQGSEKHSVVRDGRGSVILSVESSGWFSKTAREIDITGSTIFTDCGPGEMYTVEIMLPGRKLLARMMFDDSQLMREYISMITSAGHIPVDRGPAPNYF